jgi:hypothetical protein
MKKSKFSTTLTVKESQKTLDTRTIVQDFGWYEQKISLYQLLELAGNKHLKDVYVELSFMNDPYNENPHLLLTAAIGDESK